MQFKFQHCCSLIICPHEHSTSPLKRKMGPTVPSIVDCSSYLCPPCCELLMDNVASVMLSVQCPRNKPEVCWVEINFQHPITHCWNHHWSLVDLTPEGLPIHGWVPQTPHLSTRNDLTSYLPFVNERVPASFLSTWQKLELSKRREPKLKKKMNAPIR